MITAVQFGQQNSFSQRDIWTLEKMYGQRLMKEEQWVELLKGKFTFNIKTNNSLEETIVTPKKDKK